MQVPPAPIPPGLDPTFLIDQIMPLIGVIVVMVGGALGLRWIFRSPVGEALAERIRQGRRGHWGMGGMGGMGGRGGEDAQRVAALEEQVSLLQGQVSELAERLDFAERLLAEGRERRLRAGQ